MKKHSFLALSIVLALTGCGGSDSSDSSSTDDETTITEGTETDGSDGTYVEAESKALITPYTIKETIAKIDTTSAEMVREALTDCTDKDNFHYETDDLIVGFADESVNFYADELKKAAMMSQVAYTELLLRTGLNATDDLGFDESNKMIVCFDDNKTGGGTAYHNRLEFSPEQLYIEPSEFTSTSAVPSEFLTSYQLTKHEMFHVFQSRLLSQEDEVTIFLQLPSWFQESTAELFASRELSVNSADITDFMAEYEVTPMLKQASTVLRSGNISMSQLYRYYFASLAYLVDKGLTPELIIDVIKSSYDPSVTNTTVTFANFNAAISAAENQMTLPVTVAELADNVATYSEFVINGWLVEDSVTNVYTDNIDDVIYGLLVVSQSDNSIVARGSVNDEKTEYSFDSEIADGTYDVYVAAGVDGDVAYGPLSLTATDGSFGEISFVDVEICDNEICND